MVMMTTAIEAQLSAILDKLESGNGSPFSARKEKRSMQQELRSLELWRSIISECLATFLLTFLVCGSCIPWNGNSPSYVGVGIVTGVGVTTLTHGFGPISGAHLNPAMTFAHVVLKRVSLLRGCLYVTAQAGGAIAGAALLYGVTSPGHRGNLGLTALTGDLSPFAGFALECVLTFLIVLSAFASEPNARGVLHPIHMGFAYLAASLVAVPATGGSMNPARSLGPAFVMNRWDSHWLYWLGPILGGVLGGCMYEYLFNPRRHLRRKNRSGVDGESGSGRNEEDDEDEVESRAPAMEKLMTGLYSPFSRAPSHPPPPPISFSMLPPMKSGRELPPLPDPPVISSPRGGDSLYDGSKSLYEGTKSLYEGTKSMYEGTKGTYEGTKSTYEGTKSLKGSSSLQRSESVWCKVPDPSLPSPPFKPIHVSRSQSIYTGRPVGMGHHHHLHHHHLHQYRGGGGGCIYDARSMMGKAPPPPPPMTGGDFPDSPQRENKHNESLTGKSVSGMRNESGYGTLPGLGDPGPGQGPGYSTPNSSLCSPF